MLANKAVVEQRVWVRPRNTALMSASGIAPVLGAVEIPDLRLKDARMANNASVLDHWRANNPTVEVNPDQYMDRNSFSNLSPDFRPIMFSLNTCYDFFFEFQ
ncbi:unnamed protein product [Caenorhabditis nigoni]